jgi:hypothetical protein
MCGKLLDYVDKTQCWLLQSFAAVMPLYAAMQLLAIIVVAGVGVKLLVRWLCGS